jgi:ABC-2 type transport system ATP-binding protein
MINHGKLAFAGTMEDMVREKEGGSLEEVYMDVVNHEE